MKIAFVTPSYRGDFERCRLLCESTSMFLPAGIEHVLMIDRNDVPRFQPLTNRTVRIVEAETLLPWWIFRIPGVRRWWASLATLPVRNWIYQQLLKIASVNATDADVLQFVDSDVTLVRPFDPEYLVRNGKVRLQHTAYESDEHRRWLEVACRLVGLKSREVVSGNYVGNFITWRRVNVLAMMDHIRQVTGKSWVRAFCGQLRFSEYMTYGTFVDHVLGTETAGHYHDASPNLALCWGHDLQSQDGLERFFSQVPATALGVMIHSKYGIPVERYRNLVAGLWSDPARREG
jgi:hypothetical protein